MKGSAITGPVGKEAAELWPVSCPSATANYDIHADVMVSAYCFQLGCGYVMGFWWVDSRH